MGLLGRIFGSDRALEKTIGAASNAIDKLILTDEERRDYRIQSTAMVLEWVKNSQGRNLARRVIAISTTVVWLSMWLLYSALSLLSIFKPEYNTEIAINNLKYAGEYLNTPGMLILAFYFAAPNLSDIVQSVIDKKPATVPPAPAPINNKQLLTRSDEV